ncbi:hypothetical protein BAE44_0008283 [Dichanthelium oligosanthes]|uniref:Uncharacterized protein n=1 Tax=Dichanthelium oligosanthes TaxID=888268 RepID=A0A1E5W058_9POAL|nr:hypothetical protein BAE44_0008283 [Dichanthelium oligosanthes]
MAMASHHDDALWAKLHELEVQLAAYKLLRAARGEEDAGALGPADGASGTPSTCRGRQYEAYMRRRDARRVAAGLAEQQQQQQAAKAQQARAARAAGRAVPVSPRAARDAQEAGATPRLAIIAQVKWTPPAVSIPITPRRDAAALPRSKTVSGGGGGAGSSPARSSHHQRRSSLGALPEFGECATPRPFLKRGTGTGGAAAPGRLRTPRVHDLPAIDVASMPRLPLPQQQEPAHAPAPRHARSVSELPFDAAALASPQAQARPRKRWGSPERPAAMFSAASAGDSHRDLSKGLKKLLSFVRKGGRSGGAGDQQQPFPAPSPRGGGKPVSKGWSGCSLVDVPFDRASLEGHRFPMTRAVGISG